jgi:ABC-type Fe3+ transport system permease subunit
LLLDNVMLAAVAAAALSFTEPCTVVPTVAVVLPSDTSDIAVPLLGPVVELDPHRAAASAAITMVMAVANLVAMDRSGLARMRM